MCQTCWIKSGYREIVNERTRACAELIGRIYEFALAGGHAHVVVDDWNLEDDDIKGCILDAQNNENGASAEQVEAELAALKALLALDMPERYNAMAIHGGYVAIPPEEVLRPT